MKKAIVAVIAAMCAFPAVAQINATGFITYVPNSSNFDYTITLNNTGTTTIGTLWYSWVPGVDFMSALPTNLSAPAGWVGSVQGGSLGDGYSTEFVASGPASYLNAGLTLSGFKFTSSETPAQLAATSPISPFLPTGTTFVYDGAPLIGLSHQFVITPVPEPVTLLVLAPALLLMRRRNRV
ncbi:MAG: hypothetical protein ACHQ50_03945 [Fimbriimonadales bacterium]